MPADAVGPTRVSSVYVHAPFCVRRCFYCDFAVQVRRTVDADEWLQALDGEMGAVRSEGMFELADALESLYVGGGTPSLLGPAAMEGLAGVIGRGRLRSPETEWTAEANPESLTPEVARGWRKAGVNRLSLGVQSFHEGALRWMGRMHGPEGAVEAVRVAREAGYDNLSVDLIFGLPAQLGRSWRHDLERALELDVSHLSLYGLGVEPATPLGRAVAEGREDPVDEDVYGEEFLLAAELLRDAGYAHYEVSNFARPGAESRHNAVYWSGAPYLGLGNGAHSYAHPVRRWNRREWNAYRDAAMAGVSPEEGREVLNRDAIRLERLWLSLRTDLGLSMGGWSESPQALVEGWKSRGLAVVAEGAVRLTARGWLVLDRLAVELDSALSG